MDAIAKRIKEVRDNYGWSQTKFARMCCLTPQIVWNIENLSRRPSLQVLINIEKGTNISLDWLIVGSHKHNCAKCSSVKEDLKRLINRINNT